MTRNEKIIYLAGFFDAEGTICISHRNDRASYDLRITVSQKDIEPLPLFVEVFGGKIYKTHRHGVHCLNQYNLTPKINIKYFLDCVYPYLITKKKEADVAYRFILATENCENGGYWKNLTPEKRVERKICYEECKELKQLKYAYV